MKRYGDFKFPKYYESQIRIRVERLSEKMQEYLDSGLRLGWLINVQERRVEIYRSNQAVEIIEIPATITGEGVLPGLVLELK